MNQTTFSSTDGIPVKKYVPGLDGVRGLAIILVVTYHYFGGWNEVFGYGWAGVDLFFVLSGYLITSRLYETRNDSNRFKKFYWNRAVRILPIYYVTLGVFYAGFNLLVSVKNLSGFEYYVRHWPGFVFFFQNWTFIFDNGVREMSLEHFWSLAVEEQFYLFWPIFFYFFHRTKYFFQLILVLVLLIIASRIVIYYSYPGSQYYRHNMYNTFCRMDAFFAGGCMYLFQKKGNLMRPVLSRWLWIFSVIILVVEIFYLGNVSGSSPFMRTVGYTANAIFFSGLVFYVSSKSSGWVHAVFNNRWLRFTGKVSYGLFIYHWLVLVVLLSKVRVLFVQLGLAENTSIVLATFCCLLVSFAISVVSYYSFESNFLKLKMRG